MTANNSLQRVTPQGEKKMFMGVGARLGSEIGVDPILPRLAFAATFLFIEWEVAVIAYFAIAAYYAFFAGKSRRRPAERRKSRRGSVHDARTRLDGRDRRMMAIDQHLNDARSQELDREIAKLRADMAARPATGESEKGNAQ